MIYEGSTSIVVRLVVAASAAEIFAVVADPRRHPEIDGSSSVQSVVEGERLTAVGQTFTMAVSHPERGEYRSANEVVDVAADRRVVWTTTPSGQAPDGVRLSWELSPIDASRSVVVHLCDWSGVSDPDVLTRVDFPPLSAEEMGRSVDRLVALVSTPR